MKLFERIPEKIHHKDPHFVPPFPGSIRKIFSDHFPLKKHGKLFPFIAYKDGVPVGRIAAIVNRSHNEYYNDKMGFFGFLDTVNDEEVTSALLKAAEEKLVQEGLEAIRGPYNPTINDECGLLVRGFDKAPFFMMPYNPSYYLDLYEKVGLKQVRDLYAFYADSTLETPEKVKMIVQQAKEEAGITIRNLRKEVLNDELKIIVKLYNQTLDRNWGFVPITLEDMEYSAKDMKEIIDPNFVLIAEKDGVPIGFSLCIPNINEFLWKAKQSKGWLRVLKVIWYLKTRQAKELRLIVLGVDPKFRNLGVASIFCMESLVRARGKILGGELSWVEETNTDIIRAIEMMGGKNYKGYRIFEKSLKVGNA